MKVFALAMIFVYLAVGLFILFADSVYMLKSTIKNILGILLILYSFFRAYRIIKQPK